MFSNVLQAITAIIGPIPPGYEGVAWVSGVIVLIVFVCSIVRLLGGFLSIFTGGARFK